MSAEQLAAAVAKLEAATGLDADEAILFATLLARLALANPTLGLHDLIAKVAADVADRAAEGER